MRKTVYLFLIALLVLFAAITFVKSHPSLPEASDEADTLTTDEKEQVHRFWATYREATAHRMAGRMAEAEATYRKALSMNERHEDAWYYLGNVRLELGMREAARQAWEHLRELNPGSARVHARLGDLYLCEAQDALFDVDAAEAAFTHALEINKEESGPLLRLGQVALLRGDLPKAQYFFDAVTGSNFKNVEAYILNSYVAWKQGNRRQASVLLARAAEHIQPQVPAEGVPGEGDTKRGAAPLTSGLSSCPTFAPFVDDIVRLRATTDAIDAPYQKLDVFLEQLRKKKGLHP